MPVIPAIERSWLGELCSKAGLGLKVKGLSKQIKNNPKAKGYGSSGRATA
jgi:hypothetical protein